MAQRDADPYSASGRGAASQDRARMKLLALERSIDDAAELEQRGLRLIHLGGRNAYLARACVAAAIFALVPLGMVAGRAYDGTYEGALAGNWAMLGCTLCIAAATLGLWWLGGIQQRRETGQRLVRRADYQRRVARAQVAAGSLARSRLSG